MYKGMDRLQVEPAFAVGRVGGDGGSQPVVQAIFDAIAWSNGADGEAGTRTTCALGG